MGNFSKIFQLQLEKLHIINCTQNTDIIKTVAQGNTLICKYYERKAACVCVCVNVNMRDAKCGTSNCKRIITTTTTSGRVAVIRGINDVVARLLLPLPLPQSTL